jgi:magnesium transporter
MITTERQVERHDRLTLEELRDAWIALSSSERLQGFGLLPKAEAEDFFLVLPARDMAELLLALPAEEQRSWLRLAPPDDVADVIQHSPPTERERLLALLDEPTRKEVAGLLAYREDEAGGLMNPRYARVRAEMTVDEALSYLRKQARAQVETIYYVYVVDEEQRLVGVVSAKQLLAASAAKTVRDVMRTDVISVGEHTDQEAIGHLFAKHDFLAIPVVDGERRMKGLVTVDDIVDVVQEEATEDIQKFGGMEALDAPYLVVTFTRMVKKRAGWLAALFLGEMLTATAMAYFEDEIARAVVLALFMPLILSGGGNSGSQASTLVIRAMALGEVKLADWWRVVRRELATGLVLGIVLGTIGWVRIVVWQAILPTYGDHYMRIAWAIFVSLIGVVTFGTVTGSFLPFVLRRAGFDPASASAPLVATLVDVTGLVIYFSVAAAFVRGTLL